MTSVARPKRTLVGIELYRLLAEEGHRVFTTEKARELAPRVGLRESYLLECLHHLQRNRWIVPLRRGLYALSSSTPGVHDAHEFEIAMSIVNPAAVSHWSAMHHHGLTEQVPRTVFVLTTTEALVPRDRSCNSGHPWRGCRIGGITYRFIQVRPQRFFGTGRVWVDDARVRITDLERTLLDGLSKPRYCGDFAEVLHAFEVGVERLDVERIAEYASRMSTVTSKRLGRVLEGHGINGPVIDRLSDIPLRGHHKLDPSGPSTGPVNRRWMLLENVPGLRRP